MWLRNYYNLLTAEFLADDELTSTSQPTTYDPPIRVRRLNGDWIVPNVLSNPRGAYSAGIGNQLGCLMLDKLGGQMITDSSTRTNLYMGVLVGSGSTAATYDDYKLDSMITSGVTLVNNSGTLTQQSVFDGDTHHLRSVRSFTINNSSASNITINEIGLAIAANSTGTTANGYLTLVYREVLDSPVTLAPSESMILQFTRDAEVYNYTPY